MDRWTREDPRSKRNVHQEESIIMKTRSNHPATSPSANPASAEANPPNPAIQLSDFERAFAEVESEIQAISVEYLTHITVDVRLVAVNTIARLPLIRSLSAEFAEHLPNFDLATIDRVGTCALAAAHAYIRHQMSVASPAEIAKLAAAATERRARLLADVNALVAHGLIDGAPLAGLAGAVGYRNVAYDLLMLRNMLADAWPRISTGTLLSASELEEDAAIASRLLMAAGAKSVLPVEPTDTARVRDQAFALFVRKYDQLRRAVSFVRWEQGDADEYAPSLYAGRGSRKTGTTPTTDVPPATGNTEVSPSPTPAPAVASPNASPAPGATPFAA
jgi:hypothetical protein